MLNDLSRSRGVRAIGLILLMAFGDATGDSQTFNPDFEYGQPIAFASPGSRGPATLTDDDRLLADRIGRIQIRVWLGQGVTEDATILSLRGHDTFLFVAPNKTLDGFEVFGSKGDPLLLGKGLVKQYEYATLELALVDGSATGSARQWQISINGKAVATLPVDGFSPSPGERLAVEFGSKPFSGQLDQVAVYTPENLLYAHTERDTDRLVRRMLPFVGSYIAADGEVRFEQASIPGIAKSHHGVFKKATYYGLDVARHGAAGANGIGISVDWGGVLVLRPDLDDPQRYVPVRPEQAWAGTVTFESDERVLGTKMRFTSKDGRNNGKRPFLLAGKRYELVQARPGSPAKAARTTFDSSTGIPNFWFSVMACYDVGKMDLANFQDRGCPNLPLFAFPGGGDYRDRGVLKNVPYGWEYIPFVTEEATTSSVFATNSKDLNVAYTGSENTGFTLLNYTTNHNEKTENEHGNLAASERMVKVSQHLATSSRVILKPHEVYLDQCFIRYVLRAAATIKAQQLGVGISDLLKSGDYPSGPDYYDPIDSTEACPGSKDDPLSAAALLSFYGPHFAHAITYGARAISRHTVHKNTLKTMAKRGTDITSSSGFEQAINLSVGSKKKGVSVGTTEKVGYTHSTEKNSGKYWQIANSDERVFEDIACYGGTGCTATSITVGNEPIPIFLDLQRFDQLLAPPFFTDISITGALRAAVAREVDRLLESEPSSVFPPLLRMVEVNLTNRTCTYNPKNFSTPGHFFPGFAWVSSLCSETPGHAKVVALETNADGGSKPIDLVFSPEPRFSGEKWPTTPSLEAMLACFDPNGRSTSKTGASCFSRKFQMLFTPEFTRTNDSPSLAPNQFAGFSLMPETPLPTQRPVKSTSCGANCGIPFAALADESGFRYVSWEDDFDGPRNSKLVPSFARFSKAGRVPGTLRSDVATFFDGGENWFSLGIEARLKELDVAGSLGIQRSVAVDHEPHYTALQTASPNFTGIDTTRVTGRFSHLGLFYSNDPPLFDDSNLANKAGSLQGCAQRCLDTPACGRLTWAYDSTCTLFKPGADMLTAEGHFQAYELIARP